MKKQVGKLGMLFTGLFRKRRETAPSMVLMQSELSIQRRFRFLFLIFFALGSAILTKALKVQILSDERLESLSKRQFLAKVLVRPRRGPILDRNGEPLAVNVESSSLAANPSKIKNKKNVARLLARATSGSPDRIYQKLKTGREFAWIKRHLSEAELTQLKKQRLMDSEGDFVSGLWLVKESKRVYPHAQLASQVIGAVNIDAEGLEGIELWQEEKLKGKIASVRAIRDALGRPAFLDAAAAKEGKDGDAVTTTLDASLQFVVEQELKASVQKAQARSGIAIVMNAVTGEILALANEPGWNPADRQASLDHRRNRALTDGFEPGSTMKPVFLAGLLTAGAKMSDTVYGERGSFLLQGRRISEAEAHEKFGLISLKKVIQVSSNIGAAKMALRLGPEKSQGLLHVLGFGTKAGTGFPGEISGKLPGKKELTPLRLANLGFGQGILVTPLQMLRVYGAFANGGWLVEPTLIKGNPPQSKKIFSSQVVQQVQSALESVTDSEGTGTKARLDGYRVAGKTATAQVVDATTGRYSRTRYISSFIGFPVGLEQKIVIFSALDEPQGLYYASDVAAPLFSSILASVVSRFSLPAKFPMLSKSDRIELKQAHPLPSPTPTELTPHLPPAGEAISKVSVTGITASGKYVFRLPSLIGLTPREVVRVLQGRNVNLEISGHGSGVVAWQSPGQHQTLAEGATLRLKLEEP